jgi:hypothetical protein
MLNLFLPRKWPQIRCAPADDREWVGESIEGEKKMATQMTADALRSRKWPQIRSFDLLPFTFPPFTAPKALRPPWCSYHFNANGRKFAALPQMAANGLASRSRMNRKSSRR